MSRRRRSPCDWVTGSLGAIAQVPFKALMLLLAVQTVAAQCGGPDNAYCGQHFNPGQVGTNAFYAGSAAAAGAARGGPGAAVGIGLFSAGMAALNTIDNQADDVLACMDRADQQYAESHYDVLGEQCLMDNC